MKQLKLLNKLSIAIPLATVAMSGFFVSSCTEKNDSPNYERFFNLVDNSNIIDSATLDLIDQKLKNNLKHFGAFSELKKIEITDSNMNGTLDEAGYLEQSNEIFVNTKYLRKLNFKSNENKAEYLYELLFHEYSHFLNNTFLNNNITNSEQIDDKSIWRDGKQENWNKHFIDEFKTALNYNNDTKLYSSNEIAPGFVSLGARYNQKSLFEIANSNNLNFDLLQGNEVMAPINPIVSTDAKHVIKANALKYIFSLQELVARKTQIIDMKYKPNISNGEGFDNDGFIWVNGIKSSENLSPYLQDVVNYKRELNSNDGIYLDDIPTQELSDLYSKYVDANFDVNFIDFVNNKTYGADGKYSGDIDHNHIVFGGKIKMDYSNIGYFENNKFINIPLVLSPDKLSYSTIPLEVSNIVGKQLFFAKDTLGSDMLPMNSLRNGNYGEATTYENWFSNADDNYKIVFTNAELKIIKI